MFKKCVRALLSAAIVVAIVLPLSACNTVEGFGRDVSTAGDAMTDAARKVKKEE